MQLIENTYFALMVAAMQEQGFKPFSQVAISTQDSRYHVPAETARVTSLFFHLPGLNLIVRLSYNEDVYCEEQPRAYWTIRIDQEIVHNATVLKLLYPNGTENDPLDWTKDVIAFAGFRHGWSAGNEYQNTWNLEQDDTSGSPLDPQVLAGYLGEMLKKLRPYLKPTPFGRLQVTSWGADYQFPGSERIFWKRFAESAGALTSAPNYLWTIVRRPWGVAILDQ